MKFILNENKKFVLEERFILKEADTLTEASAADVAVKWTNHFKSTLDNTKQVLNKYIEFASISKGSRETKTKFTNIKETIKKAAKEMKISLSMPASELIAELPAIRIELKSYIEALQAVLTEITDKKSKKTITLLKGQIEELNELQGKTSWQKEDVEDLEEILTWVETDIYPLFDTSSIDNEVSTTEAFKTICNDCLELIKDIEASLPEDFTDFEESAVESYIYIMKEASENTKLTDASKLNKGLVIANLDTYLKTVTTLKQNYEKINQSSALNISRTKAKQKADAERAEQERLAREQEAEQERLKAEQERLDKEEEERRNPTVDWAALYKQCAAVKVNRKEALNAFWNGGLPLAGEANKLELPVADNEKIKKGYFVGEWGKDAIRVESFGTIFIESLLTEGWSAVLNPLVAILKHLFKFKDVYIDDASFSHLNTAYENKLVTEEDLRGTGVLGELNLVRNPTFYAQSPDMLDYLNWQYKFKTSDKLSQDSNNIQTIYANIVAANGNATNLKAKDTLTTIEAAKFQYKIRSLTAFQEIIKVNFKVDTSDKVEVKQATDEEVAKIVSQITTADAAKKALAYLVNLYRVTNLKLLDKLLAEPFGSKLKNNRNNTTTSFEEDKGLDELIASRKYSEAQLKELVTKLINTAGL